MSSRSGVSGLYGRDGRGGNGSSVPVGDGRWSGASGHHGGTAVPDVRTHRDRRPAGDPHRRTSTRSAGTLSDVSVVLRRLVAAVAIVMIVGACAGSPYVSFDPVSPCTTDGRFPGAFPALEARVPKTFDGRGPDALDSGRNCTTAELGTLAGHGITEIDYAGGTWNLAANAGVTLAVFTGRGLTAAWLGEWYEASARAASNTRNIDPTRPTIYGRQGYRLDTVNGDSNQTVITWDSASGDAVYVVVAADASAALIHDGILAFPPRG